MNDIAVLKTPCHMDNSVYLADIGQELISKPFSFGRPFNQTRNIYKFNCRWNYLLCMIHFSENIQPLVRHRNHSHIRVNGTKRIIR